jgi:phenylacetate-coenzyme A ligase PaaK-like adenylate-forming protein
MPVYRLWKQYLEFQWKDRSFIEDYQREKVKKLVMILSKKVPYYIDYFNKSKLTTKDFNVVEDLTKLPIITKSILRNNPGKFLVNDFSRKKLR